jgi:hypothetical protein
MQYRSSALLVIVAFLVALPAAAQDTSRSQRTWLVRVDPVDIGSRPRDERPAEIELDAGNDGRLDVSTLKIVRADDRGKPLSINGDSARDDSLPLRWYDAAIPYEFPEFNDSASRTAGKLEPERRVRAGYYLNALGDGRHGRLAWMHTQVGHETAWYRIDAAVLADGAAPQRLPPQGWIGDGQARCAAVATQSVHSDHLHLDVDDWDGDGLIDLVVGDDFGHLVWWPNLGSAQAPRFENCRLILDADGQPIDVGIIATPKVCDGTTMATEIC